MQKKSNNFFTKASDIFQRGAKAVNDLNEQKYNLAVRNLDLAERRDNLKIRQYNNGARLQIAQLEAQGQVNNAARLSELGIGAFSNPDIGSGTTIAGTSAAPTENVILWLTVAGIGFAALTYFKGH